jgi:hypothetical protein
MLVAPKQDAPLQQGDIIRDVPFVILAGALNVKAQGIQGQKRLDAQDVESFARLKEFGQGKQLLAATVPLVLQPGMVLTQSCDIDYKDHITLARVFPIGQLLEDAREAIEHGEPLVLHEVIRRITEGHDSPNLVYLGLLDGLGRCVADFMRVQSFPQLWKDCFHKNRWMSFTDEGIKYVQGRLNLFTGRYALEQGFWHTAEDREIAKQLKENCDALQRAQVQLESKKKAPKT